jgi:transcriptional regulator with XRE-family HTH domain
MVQEGIAGRVAESIPAAMTQAQVANGIGLTPEKFSRALNDKRAFSAVELAKLSEVLHVDVHWLITGDPDPYRLVVAARHDFDAATGQRQVPGRRADQTHLDDVTLAYKQAFQAWTPDPVELPNSVPQIREQLCPQFVRRLAERLESHLGVDVIRLPQLTTAYSFQVGPRKVIVIPATGNWFRENWSIAHELGHLAAAHHADDPTPTERDRQESVANAFAADLLLPAEQMRHMDWQTITAPELADRIWDLGVSTDALNTRLRWLGVAVSTTVSDLLSLRTQTLLRRHWAHQHTDGVDLITERMDQAASRRFPRKLEEAHLDLIAVGAIRKHTLAWMLGIDPDALEVEEPSPPESLDIDSLASLLAH